MQICLFNTIASLTLGKVHDKEEARKCDKFQRKLKLLYAFIITIRYVLPERCISRNRRACVTVSVEEERERGREETGVSSSSKEFNNLK